MTGLTRVLTASLAAVAVLVPAVAATAAEAGGVTDHEAREAPYAAQGAQEAVKGEVRLTVGGRFEEAHRDRVPSAVTYDEAVPVGASVTVTQRRSGERMSVRLVVDGVESQRSFGAHVHTRPCGAAPEDSGPHYQHRVDPVQPSVDPRYANPRNEVWLDFDSDARGAGYAASTHSWNFRAGQARSVVLHEHSTHTEEGHAGQAGARLACFTVPFGPGSDSD